VLSESIAAHTLELCTRCRWVISFMQAYWPMRLGQVPTVPSE